MGHIWNVCKVSGIRAMPSHVNNQKLQPRFQRVSGHRSRVSHLRSCTIDRATTALSCACDSRIPDRSFIRAALLAFGHCCVAANREGSSVSHPRYAIIIDRCYRRNCARQVRTVEQHGRLLIALLQKSIVRTRLCNVAGSRYNSRVWTTTCASTCCIILKYHLKL